MMLQFVPSARLDIYECVYVLRQKTVTQRDMRALQLQLQSMCGNQRLYTPSLSNCQLRGIALLAAIPVSLVASKPVYLQFPLFNSSSLQNKYVRRSSGASATSRPKPLALSRSRRGEARQGKPRRAQPSHGAGELAGPFEATCVLEKKSSTGGKVHEALSHDPFCRVISIGFSEG